MRIADVEPEVRALEGGAVADSLQLETLLETPRDALHHVGDQRPGQTVQRTVVAAFGRTGDGDRSLGVLDLHARRDLLRELAQRAVDHHAPGRERDVDASWQFDWLSTDSAQFCSFALAFLPEEIVRFSSALPDEAHDFAADSFLLRRS